MPVDTSSYGNAPAPFAPLQTLSGIAGLQSTLNQNKLFQQEYNSKLGLSQIYKDAIDPNTGQLDPAKIQSLISGPTGQNITMGLPQALQNSQEAQQRNLDINKSQLALAQQHLQTLEGYVAPLAANPNVSSKDVIGALSQAMTLGHVDPNTASQLYASIPRTPQGQIDEAQVPGWLKQQQMRMLDMKSQFDAMNPAPTMVNTGQQQIPVRLPQVGQPSIAGPGIQNQLPPSTPVFNDRTNSPGYLGAAGGGVGAGGAQGGFVPSGPPLGASEAAGVDATASANQGIALQQRADQAPTNKGILGNLQGELNQFNSGPGTELVATGKRFLNAQTGFGFDAPNLASREEFNKQAGMLAQSQFQVLGGTGTDAKLDATTLTSPNSELSKLGNKGIIAMLKGNEDAITAKNQAWQAFKQSNGPQSYSQFSTQFNKSYDPRVFQSQYLTPEDNKKMLSGMTKTEQKSFLNSYRTALSNGWVKLPGAQ